MRWTLADPYRGIEQAQLVVVNLRDDAERDLAQAVLAEVGRLRKDDAVHADVMGPRGSRVPITAVIANLADPNDPGTKKAIARILRTLRRGDQTQRHTATASVEADPVRAAADSALAAYRGMWTAYQEAGKVANPDDPALAVYSSGAALTTLVNDLKSIKDRGLVVKGDVVLNPRVTGISPADRPTTVEVTDCADSTNSLLYRSTGELYNSEPGGRRTVKATVQDTGGGTWKVTSFGVQDVGSC